MHERYPCSTYSILVRLIAPHTYTYVLLLKSIYQCSTYYTNKAWGSAIKLRFMYILLRRYDINTLTVKLQANIHDVMNSRKHNGQ